eukprot:m.61507 g.61507  ORF g.61507 m.61507 type:complete len:81 (-) comp11392_c0_seq1:1231-1473(-)
MRLRVHVCMRLRFYPAIKWFNTVMYFTQLMGRYCTLQCRTLFRNDLFLQQLIFDGFDVNNEVVGVEKVYEGLVMWAKEVV